MNILLFCIVTIITLIITQFAGTQIVGIVFIKLPQKDYKHIIGLLFWIGMLYLYYLAIVNWFDKYFQVYLWCSIISAIICLANLNNLKNEDTK